MDGELTILDSNGEVNDEGEHKGATVGLIRYDGTMSNYISIGADLDLFEEMIERCRKMGWGKVDLHLGAGQPLLAHEHEQEHHGIFVALAPHFPEEEDDG